MPRDRAGGVKGKREGVSPETPRLTDRERTRTDTAAHLSSSSSECGEVVSACAVALRLGEGSDGLAHGLVGDLEETESNLLRGLGHSGLSDDLVGEGLKKLGDNLEIEGKVCKSDGAQSQEHHQD